MLCGSSRLYSNFAEPWRPIQTSKLLVIFWLELYRGKVFEYIINFVKFKTIISLELFDCRSKHESDSLFFEISEDTKLVFMIHLMFRKVDT